MKYQCFDTRKSSEKHFVLSFCDLIAVSFTWFNSPNSIFLEYQSFSNCIICTLRVRYPLEVFEALAQKVRYTSRWRVLYIVKVTSTCWKLGSLVENPKLISWGMNVGHKWLVTRSKKIALCTLFFLYLSYLVCFSSISC